MTIIFRKELKDLLPYKPGKPISDVKKEFGLNQVIKLASNENPLGTSPKVKEAMMNSLDFMHIYPDGNATVLKEKLSNFTGLNVNQILPSSGSDEMVDQIAKTFITSEDEVIMADITFPRYITTTKMMGGTPIIVPLKELIYDLSGMLEKITSRTRLIWLCNPNNPTGTMFSESELLSFMAQVPKDIIVVYDEAYREFATHADFPYDSTKLLPKYENMIIMRTFSKAYGLASLRIGFTMASEEIIENINKIRGPFNVNTFAQVSAIAALEDQSFVQKTIDNNTLGKEFLYREFDKMGLSYAPTQSNHIWVNVKKDAQEVFINLQKKGVIIRPMVGTNIRVSIGLPEENEFFIHCLKEELA